MVCRAGGELSIWSSLGDSLELLAVVRVQLQLRLEKVSAYSQINVTTTHIP